MRRRGVRRALVTAFLALSIGASPVFADGGRSASQASRASQAASRAPWVGLAIGAGAGFGLGVLAGLQWFDDAINSDQKVWRTAVGFAAAGAVAGYLVGRGWSRQAAAPRRAPAAGAEGEALRDVAGGVRLRAPRPPVARPFRGLFRERAPTDRLS